jgi:hypothetical protein
MARRRYAWTEDRIERFIKDGRGSGEGARYMPWLLVSDVPSLGRCHRVFCRKTDREHHFLSDNEYFAFLRHSYDDRVVDIREQFPLDRNETLAIAKQEGIRHPAYRGVVIVMTTDLLLTCQTGGVVSYKACAVKETSDLDNPRTTEKLSIERIYWERRGVAHQIQHSTELKDAIGRNLAWIFDSSSEPDLSYQAQEREVRQKLQHLFLTQSRASLSRACVSLDQDLGMPLGRSLQIVRGMLGSKEILVDLSAANLTDLPCAEFKFAGR